jgi:hypothetical protein
MNRWSRSAITVRSIYRIRRMGLMSLTHMLEGAFKLWRPHSATMAYRRQCAATVPLESRWRRSGQDVAKILEA